MKLFYSPQRLFCLLTLGLSLLLPTVGRAQNLLAELDPHVQEQLAATGHADVLVRFGNYPDLTGASMLTTKAEKARYVVAALQQSAKQHQPLLDWLGVQGVMHRHLWAANAVYVEQATSTQVQRLRSSAGVVQLAAVSEWQIDELERTPIQPKETPLLESRASTPTWGLRFLGVPEVWAQGIRGAGAVVGGADTGYDWKHPALRASYRGNDGDTVRHDYNWFDGVTMPFPGTNTENRCGFSVNEPCDDQSHGTHTMGTMVGSTPDRSIGVAPEASWMACRNMDRGNGTPVTYLACFQFFLAPTDLDGNNPRPELGPDVIANSWYCSLSEGCNESSAPAFNDMIGALRAAGIVVVVSAGNDGNRGCNTVSPVPGRAPGAFVVGAHDSLGKIAAFSARGLASADRDQVRPDVALPGVAVVSSVLNDQYASYNGTSMSGPHAVGVFALMISANPNLRGQVDTLEALFRRSATPKLAPANDSCSAPGATVPNAVYGYGLGNALRAVELAQAWSGVSSAAFAKTPSFSLSPNPSTGLVQLQTPQSLEATNLVVSDISGRELLRQNHASGHDFIDLSHLPLGVYVVSLRSAQGISSQRLVLQ